MDGRVRISIQSLKKFINSICCIKINGVISTYVEKIDSSHETQWPFVRSRETEHLHVLSKYLSIIDIDKYSHNSTLQSSLKNRRPISRYRSMNSINWTTFVLHVISYFLPVEIYWYRLVSTLKRLPRQTIRYRALFLDILSILGSWNFRTPFLGYMFHFLYIQFVSSMISCREE